MDCRVLPDYSGDGNDKTGYQYAPVILERERQNKIGQAQQAKVKRNLKIVLRDALDDNHFAATHKLRTKQRIPARLCSC